MENRKPLKLNENEVQLKSENSQKIIYKAKLNYSSYCG